MTVNSTLEDLSQAGFAVRQKLTQTITRSLLEGLEGVNVWVETIVLSHPRWLRNWAALSGQQPTAVYAGAKDVDGIKPIIGNNPEDAA